MDTLFNFETLAPSQFDMRHYQDAAINKAMAHFFTNHAPAGIIQLATGCIAGDALVTVNRAGKGVTRSLREHYRLQFDRQRNNLIASQTRSFNGSHIELKKFDHIQDSGFKHVITLVFSSGRSLTCTPEHKILAKNSDGSLEWVQAADAFLADIVVESPSIPAKQQKKKRYRQKQNLYYHPFAGSCSSFRNGEKVRLYRVPYHRLVVEASINNVDFDDYVQSLRKGRVNSNWVYLDPKEIAVHHINGNPNDNRLENLQVLTHSQHWSIEGKEKNHLNFNKTTVATDKVVSIKGAGKTDTYDVVAVHDTSNFVANGVVVHNCGKTPMAGELIRRCIQQGHAQRILVLAHRDELVVQACNTLEACGLSVGREQGSLRADALFPAQVVVSTVQTMMRRMDSWSKDEFQLIIADEAHNYGAKRFKETLLHFNAKLLGITATIDRADKKSLEHFGDVIYSYSLWDAIHDQQGPFLTPLKFIRINMGVDLRECRTIGRKGDFNAGDLGNLIGPHIELFANAITQEIGERKTMIFMPCVGSSTAMSSALNQLGISAKWVSGDNKDRKEIVEGYKKGEFQVIVNCNLLGEGFDDKATECVVLRPTRSRIVYCQQVGRATRLHPKKDFARIIDFNHTSNMDLIGPSSLAQLDKPVADKVDKILAVDKDVSLWEAVEKAKEEIRREREEIQVAVNRLEMKYRRVEVSPFQAASNLGVLVKSDTFSDRATDKQIQVLTRMGIREADLLTKRQASKMIESMISRRHAGLCTVKQLNLLVSLGVKPFKARNMSFEEAGQTINRLMGQSA